MTPFELGGLLFDIVRTIATAVVAALVVRAITRSRDRTLPSGEPDPANRARACATASWLLTVGAMATSFLSPSRMRFLSGVAGTAPVGSRRGERSTASNRGLLLEARWEMSGSVRRCPRGPPSEM